MFKIELDDAFIDILAAKIADRATEMIAERIPISNDLPVVLTRTEAMRVLRCGPTTMARLMQRADFPVNRQFGVKIPTNLLIKWIEVNTWTDSQ